MISLNPIQYKFWLDDKLKYPAIEYNDTNFTFVLEGDLSLSVLYDAYYRIMSEYPPFHSKVCVMDGKPFFNVDNDFSEVPFEVIEKNPYMPENEVVEMIRSYCNRSFTLSEEYPCRFYAIHSEGKWYLLNLFHHIVMDGISLDIFFRRLSSIYNDILDGTYTKMDQTDLIEQFNVKITNQYLDVRDKNLSYWEDYLRDVDFSQSFHSEPEKHNVNESFVYSFDLGNHIKTSVDNFKQRFDTTVFRVLSVAWSVTLAKFLQIDQLILDHALNLRPKDELCLLGVFVNNLPIKYCFSPDVTMHDLIRYTSLNMSSEQLHCLSFYNDLFPHLARKFPEKELKQLNIGLVYPTYNELELNFRNCIVKPFIHIDVCLEQDFVLGVDRNSELTCHLRHLPKYSNEYVESLAESFRCVLLQILEQPEIRFDEIELVSELTRQSLLKKEEISLHAADSVPLFLNQFMNVVKAFPNHIAVSYKDTCLTYAELNSLSDRVAKKLVADGFHNKAIAISMPKCLEILIGILGIIKSGNCYVPIDEEYPKSRIDFILSDCDIDIVLVNAETKDIFSDKGYKIEDLLDHSDVIHVDLPEVLPSDNAYVIYTSGTTGSPKGIPIKHSMLAITAHDNACFQKISPESRVIQFANICFDASIVDIFPILEIGGTLVLAPKEIRKDPSALLEFLQEQQITSFGIPPALLSILPHMNLLDLETIVVGGDTTSIEAVKFWSKGRNFINGYGPTENTVDATYAVLSPDSHNRDIGTSVPGTTCYVLDSNMKLMPDYAIGELYLGGKKLTEGYINRPELNETKFVDNPYVSDADKAKGINTRLYKTGDLVMRRTDGHLIFIGRSDNQVKLHGYRVELGDIESKILEYNHGIKNVVVILHQYNDIKQLVAYLQVSDAKHFSIYELNAFLSVQLPEYMIPSVIMPLDEFPFNTSGKVDRKRLPAPIIMQKKEVSDPLCTETEFKIANILNDLLGVSVVNRTDSLISLGADSISIIMLTIRIEEMFGFSIRASEIYSHIHLKDLAEYLDNHVNRVYREDERLISEHTHTDMVSISPSLLSLYMQCAHSVEMRRAYNLPCMFECPSSMEIENFVTAFNQLVKYRDSFRMSFPMSTDGLPYIKVSQYQFVPIEVIHITGDELSSCFNADWYYDFDLENGPLYRCRLYKVDNKRYVCSLIMHHLISDGWSVMLIHRDLLQLLSNGPVSFPNNGYIDFVLESSSYAVSDAYNKRLEYWQSYLNGVSNIQFLSKQSEYIEGNSYHKRIPESLSEKVVLYCRKNSCTPYVFYGGIYLMLLARILRQTNFAVGIPFLGREKRVYENVTGYFIHTLPWCFLNEYNSFTFNEFLNVLHNCLIQGEENAVALKDIERIYRDSGMETLLIQTMFSYEKNDLIYEYMNHRYSTFNIALTVLENEGCAEDCLWEYRTSCFSESEISIFSDSYLTLISDVLECSNKLLPDYNIVSDSYIQQIVQENTVAKVYKEGYSDVMTCFERNVNIMPSHPAVIYKSKVLTYQELSEWRDKIATHMTEYGIHPGNRIGISMDNSSCCLAVILGILKAGCCYVPMDVALPYERKQFILHDASCSLLIEDGQEEDSYKITKIESCQSNDLYDCRYAYIIYTSGTTGKPKGIPVTRSALAYLCNSEKKLFELSEESKVLQFASISFDASVTELFTTLVAGSTMVIATQEDKHDPKLLANLLESQSITCATIPPALLPLVPHRDYPNLQTLIVGGESVSKAVADEWSRTCRFINAYGPTENTVDTTMCIVSDTFEFNNIGIPLPGVSCYILDEHGRMVPPGVIGELCIGGLQLTDGYLNRDELNLAKFIPNSFQSGIDKELGINDRLYRSGDLVKKNPDGSFVFIGRVDNQIKLRGFRIELSEIESTIQEYDGVNRAVVQIIQHDGKEELAVYVQPMSEYVIQFQSLLAFLRKRLPVYMIPSLWASIQEFPLTVNGKIDYKSLPKADYILESHEKTELSHDEEVLLRVAKEVLGMDNLDVRMDLIDAGMNSLYVMDFVSRIADLGYRQITISSIYQKRSIRELLAHSTNRFYFWATEDDPKKPLMVLICGYPYFSPFYGDFINYFKNDFSIFVFESYHEFFLWKKDISLEILFKEYYRVLTEKIKGRKIDVLTGYCMGSELAVAFANYMEDNYSDFLPLRVLNLEGIFERPKNSPMPYIEDVRIREHRRITDILTNEQKPMIFKGDILHFMAGQFSSRIYLEGGEEDDKELLEEVYKGMLNNFEIIKQHYPNSPFFLLECTHWNFFEKENLQKIREKMAYYWNL